MEDVNAVPVTVIRSLLLTGYVASHINCHFTVLSALCSAGLLLWHEALSSLSYGQTAWDLSLFLIPHLGWTFICFLRLRTPSLRHDLWDCWSRRGIYSNLALVGQQRQSVTFEILLTYLYWLYWEVLSFLKFTFVSSVAINAVQHTACRISEYYCSEPWEVMWQKGTYSFLSASQKSGGGGVHGGTVAKVLCYKSEGRWFDPSWRHWNFLLI